MAQPISRSLTPPAPRTPAPPPRRRRFVRTLLATVVLPILLGTRDRARARDHAVGKRARAAARGVAGERPDERRRSRSARCEAICSPARRSPTCGSPTARGVRCSRARRVRFSYALGPALRGRLVLRSLVLDTPVVVLDKQPGARWNFQSLMRPSGGPRDTTQQRARPGARRHHDPSRALRLSSSVAPRHDAHRRPARLGDRGGARRQDAKPHGARGRRLPARARVSRHRRAHPVGAPRARRPADRGGDRRRSR